MFQITMAVAKIEVNIRTMPLRPASPARLSVGAAIVLTLRRC